MKTIKLEIKNQIAYVQLNRPEVRNAFHPDMIQEITDLFTRFKKEKNLRIVVLSGAGKSFCAGADLEWMKSMVKFSKKQNIKDAEKLFKMFSVMEACDQVLIGQVHGHAMGGALGLLAVCDLVAAEKDSEFCFSEAKLGLSPAVISAFVKNKVSSSELSRWFLTADIFKSEHALKMGLIQFAGEMSEVDSQVQSWVTSVLRNGPQAVVETKKLLRSIRGIESSDKLKKITTELIAKLRVSAEGQEGIQSFLMQKKPNWRTHEGN